MRLHETHNTCDCLCSSSSYFPVSCIRNIDASDIRDFKSCHNVKSPVCCDFLIQSKNGFDHFKEQLKRLFSVVLRKKLFVILCSAVRKLYKLSNLLLLITTYSCVYSIYLFCLSIYSSKLLVVGVSYQRVPCLAEGYS